MMNLASIIILALIIAAVVFAIRYTSKHGTCETCGLDGKAHCGSGSCGTCAYHEGRRNEEIRAAWLTISVNHVNI